MNWSRLRTLASRAFMSSVSRGDVFIRRYDRPFTLFYIDPPYWGHETDYGRDLFSRGDFARMAELLRGLKGQFILSLNDRPEVREIFDGFVFEEVATRYSSNARSARKAAELLISGNAPADEPS